MKVRCFTYKYRWKKWIPLLTVLLFCNQLASAQEMNMHKMKATQKNIFLRMMDTMMIKMSYVTGDGSVSQNFFDQMIPHHKGAIEMAKYELQHGKDFAMIQLAKSIAAEQKIEVQQMNVLKQSSTDTAKSTAAFRRSIDETMKVMMQDMRVNLMPTDTDKAFARTMIPHHLAAVYMAKAVIKFTKDRQALAFAKHIISSQQVEIEQMSSFLKN